MEYIPDELLFEILLCLPAQDIYCGARLVCRKWYHMIHCHNFISTHLQHATYGLLSDDGQSGIEFISVRNGEIETYKLMNHKLRLPIWTSCNGLVLEDEGSCSRVYSIANISTHQYFRLPPHPISINHSSIAIGYAAASGTYKVCEMLGSLWEKRCCILTVGVDKSWRFISTNHLSPSAVNALYYSPLVTEGFMHWICDCDVSRIVTLNVETETITETALTISVVVGEKIRSTYRLSTGRYLSLLISCGELAWEVWEMKSETGEWRKLQDICLESDKEGLECLRPCGWVKYPEVLAFKSVYHYGKRGPHYFYNLVKGEISSKMICSRTLVLHKNSLVSPVGWRMLS